MFLKSDIGLRLDGDRRFALMEDLVYSGRDENFTVPAGTITDLASTPAVIAWLFPSYGRYTLAAILHDYLCQQLRAGVSKISSPDVDGIFRRVMQELGVPFVRRWFMWGGVRLGAIFDKHRRPGSLSTLPKVVLLFILSMPIVFIPSLFVGLGLLIDKIVELL